MKLKDKVINKAFKTFLSEEDELGVANTISKLEAISKHIPQLRKQIINQIIEYFEPDIVSQFHFCQYFNVDRDIQIEPYDLDDGDESNLAFTKRLLNQLDTLETQLGEISKLQTAEQISRIRQMVDTINQLFDHTSHYGFQSLLEFTANIVDAATARSKDVDRNTTPLFAKFKEKAIYVDGDEPKIERRRMPITSNQHLDIILYHMHSMMETYQRLSFFWPFPAVTLLGQTFDLKHYVEALREDISREQVRSAQEMYTVLHQFAASIDEFEEVIGLKGGAVFKRVERIFTMYSTYCFAAHNLYKEHEAPELPDNTDYRETRRILRLVEYDLRLEFIDKELETLHKLKMILAPKIPLLEGLRDEKTKQVQQKNDKSETKPKKKNAFLRFVSGEKSDSQSSTKAVSSASSKLAAERGEGLGEEVWRDIAEPFLKLSLDEFMTPEVAGELTQAVKQYAGQPTEHDFSSLNRTRDAVAVVAKPVQVDELHLLNALNKLIEPREFKLTCEKRDTNDVRRRASDRHYRPICVRLLGNDKPQDLLAHKSLPNDGKLYSNAKKHKASVGTTPIPESQIGNDKPTISNPHPNKPQGYAAVLRKLIIDDKLATSAKALLDMDIKTPEVARKSKQSLSRMSSTSQLNNVVPVGQQGLSRQHRRTRAVQFDLTDGIETNRGESKNELRAKSTR